MSKGRQKVLNGIVKAFPELNLLLNSPFMQLWLFFVSKYFNFATISKDLLAIFT